MSRKYGRLILMLFMFAFIFLFIVYTLNSRLTPVDFDGGKLIPLEEKIKEAEDPGIEVINIEDEARFNKGKRIRGDSGGKTATQVKFIQRSGEDKDSNIESSLEDMSPKELKKFELTKEVSISEYIMPSPEHQRKMIRFDKDRRYYLHVTTDLPSYKPGDSIFLKGVLLDSFFHKPVKQSSHNYVPLKIEILDAQKSLIMESLYSWNVGSSVISAEIRIPDHLSGGEYTIKSSCSDPSANNHILFPPAERSIRIWKYSKPKFIKSIEFGRKSYGHGDTVSFVLKARRSEGGELDPKKSKISCFAKLSSDITLQSFPALSLEKGQTYVSFKLPKILESDEGWVACQISEGGVETVTKRIPIIKQNVHVRFFPSLGTILSGVSNDVYFDVHSSEKEMEDIVDIEGQIITYKEDATNEDEVEVVVPSVRTVHEGRGMFTFVPKPNARTALRVTKPVKQVIPLENNNLELSDEGIKVQFMNREGLSVFNFGEEISISLERVGKMSSLNEAHFTLYKREELVFHKKLDFQKEDEISMSIPSPEYDGVLRMTIYDSSFIPVSERLIFIRPRDELDFEVNLLSSGGMKLKEDGGEDVGFVTGPGEKVMFEIIPKKTKNAIIKPQQQNSDDKIEFSVTISDDRILRGQLEKRDYPPSLLSQVFLENEIEGFVYDSNSYFSDDDVNLDFKLSLLLGVQGWRRFIYHGIYHSYNEYKKSGEGDKIKRLLAVEEEVQYFYQYKNFRGREENEMMMMADNDNVAFAEAGAAPPQVAPRKVMRKKGKKKGNDNKPQLVLPPIIVVEEDEREDRKPLHKKSEILFVREYAYVTKEKKKEDEFLTRTDFQETIFFKSDLMLSSSSEENDNRVVFHMNDAITSFRIVVEGYNQDGVIGRTDHYVIRNTKSFYIEPKLPKEVSHGDIIQIPVQIVNNLQSEVTDVTIETELGGEGFSYLSTTEDRIIRIKTMKKKERLVRYVQLKVTEMEKDQVSLRFLAHANLAIPMGEKTKSVKLSDDVEHHIDIVSSGFPFSLSFAGSIRPTSSSSEDNSNRKVHLKLPPNDQLLSSSFHGRFVLEPTPLGTLTEAVKGLIRMPCGCFEQTSSSMFPMIMALQYLESHQSSSSTDTNLIEDISNKLEVGYKKLLSYEVPGGGFEWFGKAPAHESLTAMGLFEFIQLEKLENSGILGFKTDPEVIPRTTKWLLSRIDHEKKQFKLNKKALDSFGYAPSEIQHAYILWTMSMSMSMMSEEGLISWKEVSDVAMEVYQTQHIIPKKEKKDSYVLALAAMTMHNFGMLEESKKLAKLVFESIVLEDRDDSTLGQVDEKYQTTSVTNSRNRNLWIETSAASLMACLSIDSDQYGPELSKTYNWILSQNRKGRFGSTQGTVLALQAIQLYDEFQESSRKEGEISVTLKPIKKNNDDEVLVEELGKTGFTGDSEKIEIEIDSSLFAEKYDDLKILDFDIMIEMNQGFNMPYHLDFDMFVERIPSDVDVAAALDFKTSVTPKKLKEGETGQIHLSLENLLTDQKMDMLVAVISLPAGLSYDFDQLRSLKDRGLVDHFEMMGYREIVLYFRGLDRAEEEGGESKKELIIPGIVANIPGVFKGRCSRAYVYYDDDVFYYNEPLEVEISINGEV